MAYEGIAQWVSGGLPDIIMNQKDSVLEKAILSDRYIPFAALDVSFPRTKEPLMLAYAESRSLIEYIIHEYGQSGILILLEHLKDGDEVNLAIVKSFSITFVELEKRWYISLKKRITWIAFLLNNIYEILFFLGALLVIYAFIKSFLKKRAYSKYEEEDL